MDYTNYFPGLPKGRAITFLVEPGYLPQLADLLPGLQTPKVARDPGPKGDFAHLRNKSPLGVKLSLSRLVILISLLFSLASRAQTITISGEVTKPLTLQAADLKAMPHTNVTATDRDGKEHTYAGVPLAELLKQAGATLGAELRGENLTKYVIVKAVDGYEVLYALPEIDPEFATRTILLADSVDSAPLPKGVGPYRMVVPGEKKPARWIREVKSIEVRFAK